MGLGSSAAGIGEEEGGWVGCGDRAPARGEKGIRFTGMRWWTGTMGRRPGHGVERAGILHRRSMWPEALQRRQRTGSLHAATVVGG